MTCIKYVKQLNCKIVIIHSSEWVHTQHTARETTHITTLGMLGPCIKH